MVRPNLDTAPLPDELEWGTLAYLNKELSTLLSDYGLENILDELSKLCHEAAHYSAVEHENYPAQVQWDKYGDYLSGLKFLMFSDASRR